MKKSAVLILLFLTGILYISAQDTLYVYKAGNLLYKTELSKVDSIGFNHLNYPPYAMNDNATVLSNSSIIISILTNDSDPEGDPISIFSTTNPTNGTITVNANGTITYTPQTGFVGNDSFTYTITDGDGGFATGTVSIIVTNTMPYTGVTPKLYYIIGLGDGNWTNSQSGLGKSLIPMSIVSGNKYDYNGNGEFTYTGYFTTTRSFKLIRDIGSFAETWGMTNGVYIHNGGDNIALPANGFYTITLNSINNTLSIVPSGITPTNYSIIGFIGDFTNWITDVLLTPAEMSDNHVWYGSYTFTSDCIVSGGGRFRANGIWNFNWGDSTFPYGKSIKNGADIIYKAGTYTIIFNDIDGTYYFFKQ